jgi:type III restriction enzyme
MELQLEELSYQRTAIKSVVNVFDGTTRNTFDNATAEGIRFNQTTLTPEQIAENIKAVIHENGIDKATAKLSPDNDLCIEMETGTGKTLVYIKTIYELYKQYGFTKFIILVPSVAIRQGTLGTFKNFAKQLEAIYGFQPHSFEYDSKKLNKVTGFIEDQHPHVMIMTLAAFNSDDKILNQAQREDLFNNIPFIDAIGKTRPIILMDEPQEGMDTDNSIRQIAKLNPLAKIRYSATHKVVKNLLYRLTPYDSYKQGLVKKIEVLTVTEKNDEATIKIELAETQNGKGDPKAKLKVWKQKSGKFVFEETQWLKVGDNLGEKVNNPSYLNYTIERIAKSLRDQKWRVTFTNGTEVIERQTAGNVASIWALQLEWLINRHFAKSQRFAAQGIKCLSLIFIDKVANYMSDDPVIKNLFIEKYKAIYPEWHNGQEPTPQHIQDIQGYYFAATGKGEYTDSEVTMKSNKEIYDLILRKKDELLSLDNPVQFIFSHSALGVGWDNPNIFNIATLNTAYSEIRKRQEIGRGLRICVNQQGQRVYDLANVTDDDRINELTVIPNETYETFVTQYQEEIKEVYGNTKAGATFTHTHKGKPANKVTFKLNPADRIQTAFKQFWAAMAKKTDFTVAFDEQAVIDKATAEINKITISDYVAEVSSQRITDLSDTGVKDEYLGGDTYKLRANFAATDFIEELSENTGVSYPTIFAIVSGLTNFDQLIKNPPRFIQAATNIIRKAELDEMIRGLEYHTTGESYPFSFGDFVKNIDQKGYVDTPTNGVFDKMLIDSDVEGLFSKTADRDPQVVCFLKLPSYYKIKTPIGNYEPDFGLVMKRKSLKSGNEAEFYFVIETKGTNDINDTKALTESEIYKIKCAMKHFKQLGVPVYYEAPVKEYTYFKGEADKKINAIMQD